MNKRQMLEFAADAACIKILAWHNDCPIIEFHDLGYVKWNPLEDDGDALRLAVKLNISINRPVRGDNEQHFGTYADDFNQKISVKMNDKSDPYAATRYAVVSVAAQIGKDM